MSLKEELTSLCAGIILSQVKVRGRQTFISEDSGINRKYFNHKMFRLLREELGTEEIYCVHRLDRETGGLMVYARTKNAAAAISKAIEEGRMQKEYLAVAEGEAPLEGTLRDLLYRDAARNKSYVVKRMRKGVREAELRYERLAFREGLSLLRIQLKTGRSHQIRVQFASRGFPLVGDKKYGSTVRDAGLALWSTRLSLPHPGSGETLSAELPPPEIRPWTLFSDLF